LDAHSSAYATGSLIALRHEPCHGDDEAGFHERGLRGAETDRLDARWLCVLLAKEMLPESWLPSAEIQTLRDQTRLRKALAEDRTRWAQRLQALLTHEGWPCQRARLLTVEGRRWVESLSLSPAARSQVGRLAEHGAPVLRWALVEAAQHAQRANSPDRVLYTRAATRIGGKRAVLTVARKIGRRAYHVLRELETQAA
jgi:Transposase